MNERKEIANKTVKIALKHAQSLLLKLSGYDRIALTKEYKEWLNPDGFDDDDQPYYPPEEEKPPHY